MKIELLTSDDELPEVARVLIQLRPQYSLDAMIAQQKTQRESGYQIACVRTGGRVIGTAGVVVGKKLAWGKQIYVDDLVSDEKNRGAGVGASLITWLQDYGVGLGC
jgi:hypothetical protein